MELVIFISVVSLCAIALVWLTTRPGKSRKQDHQSKKQTKEARANLLATPSEYLLSKPGEVWRTKREQSVATSRGAEHSATSAFSAEPGYDGYSRRDRHDFIVGTAQIRKKDLDEDVAVTPVEYKEDKAAG